MCIFVRLVRSKHVTCTDTTRSPIRPFREPPPPPPGSQTQVVMYGHQLTREQWGSVALVFAGLSGEVYDKYEKKQRKAREAGKKAE